MYKENIQNKSRNNVKMHIQIQTKGIQKQARRGRRKMRGLRHPKCRTTAQNGREMDPKTSKKVTPPLSLQPSPFLASLAAFAPTPALGLQPSFRDSYFPQFLQFLQFLQFSQFSHPLIRLRVFKGTWYGTTASVKARILPFC